MTRKEIKDIAKRYYLAIFVALPLIIILDVLIEQHVQLWVMVIIDMVLMGAAIIVGQVIYDKRRKTREAKKAAKMAQTKDMLKTKSTHDPDADIIEKKNTNKNKANGKRVHTISDGKNASSTTIDDDSADAFPDNILSDLTEDENTSAPDENTGGRKQKQSQKAQTNKPLQTLSKQHRMAKQQNRINKGEYDGQASTKQSEE